jgi:hypothetical protein
MSPRLQVVCTDKGAHPSRTLGFLQFDVQRDRGVIGPGGGIYPATVLLGDDLAEYLLDPVYGPPLVTLTGGNRGGARVNRKGDMWAYPNKGGSTATATSHRRKDGKQWFTFTCRTCGRSPQVSGDDLTRIASQWPSDVLDVSQLGR